MKHHSHKYQTASSSNYSRAFQYFCNNEQIHKEKEENYKKLLKEKDEANERLLKEMKEANERLQKEREENYHKWILRIKNDKILADIDKHCNSLDDFLKEHGYTRENQLYKAETPNEKTVVIVCHGGVISAFISYLANLPFFQFISHMGSDLTAVTKIHFHGKAGEFHPAQLIYVNSQAHLEIK